MTYTTVSSLSTSQSAYDRLVYFALRPELYFDRVATVKPVRQAMPGTAVIFTQTADLSVASTALNESTDVTPVAMSDSQVTVTLAEYGNAVIATRKLKVTSFVPVDDELANVVGFNAGISVDTLARDVLKAGSNVYYSTGTGAAPLGRTSVTPLNTLTADDCRLVLAKLRGAFARPFDNGLYTAFIHPDVSYDLRRQTGAAAWRDPHTYSQPEEIWTGEIGAFEGSRFVETPRAPVFADAGSSTTLTDVYGTIFCAQQAMAKAYGIQEGAGPFPQSVITPVTDNLRRLTGLGWYWIGQYGRFREACIRRVESASSIGTNS